jgi:hypothetical protein
MTSLKTVLLGSAAALVAAGAAQAADLPVKKAAAAVQYVEVCPVYGSGFYKLPGTDICIRHFGSVKFTFAFQDERSAYEIDDPVAGTIDLIGNAGASSTVGWQWTIRPGWDFRSPTEYGTLRTVVQMRVDHRNGILEGDFDDDDINQGFMTGSMRTSSLIHRGYIEWAGFLVGRAGTQFAYWDQDDVVSAVGGDPKETPSMQLTYVFSAPGGLKATIGLEDSSQWDGGVTDLTTLAGGGVSVGPQRLYDIVATLSTEQSWGSAKIAGLLHWIHSTADVDGDGFADNNDQEAGWGILGGVTFNLPMLGPKDQLLLQAVWCDGANGACGVNAGATNDPTSFERRGQFFDGLQRLGDVDAYAVDNGAGGYNLETTKIWTVAGQLRHYWAPLWRSNLSATYTNISVPEIAFTETGYGDAAYWDVELNLIWGQSRKTAEIGIAALYGALRQDVSPAVEATAEVDGIDTDPEGWAIVGFISRAW